MSTRGHTLERDLAITDNGDGTWDVLVLLTGPHRTVGHTGKLINKDDGQTRVIPVIDAATGESVGEPEVVFRSTGTNGDFCGAVLTHRGIEVP